MSFYEYNEDIDEDYAKGFDIRKNYFNSEINFYAPSIKSYETEDFKNGKSDSFPPLFHHRRFMFLKMRTLQRRNFKIYGSGANAGRTF